MIGVEALVVISGNVLLFWTNRANPPGPQPRKLQSGGVCSSWHAFPGKHPGL